MDGRRQIRRYVPELETEGVQDLPPEDLRRYACKMATGSGKTWVMAMTVVWSHFHRKCVPGSDLSTNFLIVAPNVIVYQCLEKDFGNNRIFAIPLIRQSGAVPGARKSFCAASTEPDRQATCFSPTFTSCTNHVSGWTPQNAISAMDPNHERPSVCAALRAAQGVQRSVVLNEKWHHVTMKTAGVSRCSASTVYPKAGAWLTSATPKDQNGMYFLTVCVPPGAGCEDRVAAPITSLKDDPLQPGKTPTISAGQRLRKYAYWLQAAAQRWKRLPDLPEARTRPVQHRRRKNTYADAIGEYVWKTVIFLRNEVLDHTDTKGEITKDLKSSPSTRY
jgi:type III restriction enzyme